MYKTGLYIFSVLISVFALSGINFSNFFKKGYIWEARIFMIIISLIMGYLLASFLIIFMEVGKIF